jgi:hypothetical protein
VGGYHRGWLTSYEHCLKLKHAKQMNLTGVPLKGLVFVYVEGYSMKAALRSGCCAGWLSPARWHQNTDELHLHAQLLDDVIICHSSYNCGMRTKGRICSLFTILLLLMSQLAVVVHAAEHPFHVEDTYCEALLIAEHHNAADIVASHPLAVVVLSAHASVQPADHFVRTTDIVYQGRAPPAS